MTQDALTSPTPPALWRNTLEAIIIILHVPVTITVAITVAVTPARSRVFFLPLNPVEDFADAAPAGPLMFRAPRLVLPCVRPVGLLVPVRAFFLIIVTISRRLSHENIVDADRNCSKVGRDSVGRDGPVFLLRVRTFGR